MADLQEIVQLIKSGRKDQARQQLLDYLQTNRADEQAWLYMASVASNKTEFMKSVQRVLEINPLNRQARDLAEKYDIPMPAGAEVSSASRRKDRKRDQKTAAEPRRRRSCLLPLVLLLLVVMVAAGAFVVLQGGDEADVTTETTGTGTPIAAAVDSTAEATLEATVEAGATIEVTAEPASTAEAMPATVEPTEEPAATLEAAPATVEATIEATAEAVETTEPTPAASPTAALVEVTPTQQAATPTITPTSDSPVLSLEVRSAGENSPAYAANVPLEIALQKARTTEVLTLEITLMPPDGNAEPLIFAREIQPGPAQTIVIPIKAAQDDFAAGTWEVGLTVNGEDVPGTQFVMEAGTSSNTAAATSTPRPTQPPPARTEEAPFEEIMLALVYDEDSAYLLNTTENLLDVSTLRFVQGDRVFEVMEWQEPLGSSRTVGTVYQMQAGRCFQVGITSGAASQRPVDCLAISSWVPRPDPASHFWLPAEAGVESFEVYQGETLLTTCELNGATSSCEFGLLPAE